MKDERITYDMLWRQLAQTCDAGEAKSIIRLVLEKRFGLSSTDVYCGKTEAMGDKDTEELNAIVSRLVQNEPVQYVLGEAEFDGRDFLVHRGVLIPRPETAELVRIVVDDFRKKSYEKTFLDIGTGSGCIATSLALDLPNCHVTAWDLSEIAIKTSQENALRYSVDVDVCKVDMLHPPHDIRKWDAIVSNPPYICEREKVSMDKNVLDYEPAMALFVPDEDPLCFYRAIAYYGNDALKESGQLYFEINPIYADDILRMLGGMGYREAESATDMFGKKRFVKCRL